eukprot:EC688592.1.p3 GENE.EC688592.1~~EC688592.1.p3  ORF type:complete len:56 (-),score=17.87 EC688592.1:34-201(-)
MMPHTHTHTCLVFEVGRERHTRGLTPKTVCVCIYVCPTRETERPRNNNYNYNYNR